MIRSFDFRILILLTCLCTLIEMAAAQQLDHLSSISIIPQPAEMSEKRGEFVLSASTVIVSTTGERWDEPSLYLQERIARATGTPLEISSDSTTGILFTKDLGKLRIRKGIG